jgi:ABC-type phosphate/phosphonate transport system ATPase subunit
VSEIRLDQVGKVYAGDVRAVDDVSLTIASGEFMVLVGRRVRRVDAARVRRPER